MFVKKTQSEIDALNDTDLEKYIADKEAHEAEQLKQAINKAAEPLNKKINDLESELMAIKEQGKEQEKAKAVTLVKEIKENKDALKAILKGNSTDEIALKANVVRASIATNAHVAFEDGVGQIQRKKRSLYNLFPKFPFGDGNNNGTLSYLDWDEATTVKAAAMIAEGAAFPESTAAFKMYSLPLQKVGDTLPVSEEFFEDEQLAAAELDMFLATNVEDKIDEQIVNGAGTGSNLTGLVASVPTYTPVASGIAGANIYDLVIKTMEQITSTGGNKYQPDFVAMNIADINLLRLKKDTTQNYVFDRNDDRIMSLNIIEDNNVAPNSLIVGDSRYARIYEKGGVVLSKGEINAQFTSDMSTLKARKRLLFLIRNVDKTGFRKVTSISAALTLLAT